MRYTAKDTDDNSADSMDRLLNTTIVGTTLRHEQETKTLLENVANVRHQTTGDSLAVQGTPLYMHIPSHQARPTVHQVPNDHFDEGFRETEYRYRGMPNSPMPAAYFGLVGDYTDLEGELYLKPGKDFAFSHYLGYVDWIANRQFYLILENLGPDSLIPHPVYNHTKFTSHLAFVP
jgi:hypothetical protein